MPKAVTIMARTSSITNAFYNGIIPVIEPTEAEINNALNILGIDQNDVRCCYCGDVASEWDHLRPLIVDKKHTGYISEIDNLVPCCGKCNQSKGNKNWEEWINSTAKLSPKTRGIKNLDEKIGKIKKYENSTRPKKIDIELIIGKELWEKHLQNYEEIINIMKKCQQISDEIKGKIKKHFKQ
jgi:endonuclease I